MSDCRTYRLTCSRIHPKSADHIVITRTCSKPLALIEDIDLHLVVIEIRLSYSELSHLQLIDICIKELLCLREKVVDVNSHGSSLASRRRCVLDTHSVTVKAILTVLDIPEYDEMFRLLRTAERPLRATVHHVECELLRLIISVKILYVSSGKDKRCLLLSYVELER